MGRPKVLSALDSAKTQYYHFKAIVMAGMGLFTDAYDLFCIPPVMGVIGRIYYADSLHSPGVTPPGVVSAVVGIALLGTATGQVVFGRLGDKMGRRKVYGVCLLLMVFSSIGCGFSICRTRKCVLTSLCLFRFLLGIGIGGDYPLSATIMSEFANRTTRGAFIAAVFSMQGFGILVSSCVTMAVMASFKRVATGGAEPPPAEADLAWRLVLMIGAIPAGLTFYWRMMMPETARYTALVEMDVRKATRDMQMVFDDDELRLTEEEEEEEEEEERERCEEEGEENVAGLRNRMKTTANNDLFSLGFFRAHGRDLFACSGSWFLLDVVFYSSTLFQSRIYKYINYTPKRNVYDEAFNVAKFHSIVALCSTIPGYWAAVYLIDRVGRKKLHVTGFFLMAVFLFAIGLPYHMYWEKHMTVWFVVLYSSTFFFANLGPNTTTFIVPAEMFPARFRSTCHGLAGAAGKVGAICGSIGFLWASQSDPVFGPGIGMTATLLILAGVSVVGVVFAVVFMRETKGISLEENEDAEEDDYDVVNHVNNRASTESETSQSSSNPLHVSRTNTRSPVAPVERRRGN